MRIHNAVVCCVLSVWSIHVSAAPNIQYSRPIAKETWITKSDYPATEAVGSVSYKVVIGLTGEPQECTVTKSSGDSVLDKSTCELIMQRARFTPASIDGKPQQASYFDTVRWTSRGTGTPFTISPRDSVIEFDVDGAGKIKNCKVEGAKLADEKRFCRDHDRISVPQGEEQYRNVHVKQTTRVEITPN